MEVTTITDPIIGAEEPVNEMNLLSNKEDDSLSKDSLINNNTSNDNLGQLNALGNDDNITSSTQDTEFHSLDNLYTKQMAWNSVFQSAFVDPNLNLNSIKEIQEGATMTEQVDPTTKYSSGNEESQDTTTQSGDAVEVANALSKYSGEKAVDANNHIE